MAYTEDLIGKRFGQLTVIAFAGVKDFGCDKNGKQRKSGMWLCRCDCGNEVIVARGNLTHGNSKSCGHTHWGHSRHGIKKQYPYLYARYRSMIDRVTRINDVTYKHYISKNITVCDEWYTPGSDEGLYNFVDWAFANGYKEPTPDTPKNKRLTLDRIKNAKGYGPDNCRWRTMKQQGNNRTVNRYLIVNNERYSFQEFADYCGYKKCSGILHRITNGWTHSAIVYAYLRFRDTGKMIHKTKLGEYRDENGFIVMIHHIPYVDILDRKSPNFCGSTDMTVDEAIEWAKSHDIT